MVSMEPLDWSLLTKRSRGRLPHWEIPGMTVFLTFRTADSLPAHVVEAYRAERQILAERLKEFPTSKQLRQERVRLFCKSIDRVLDTGAGACHLSNPLCARFVLETLQNRNGSDYALHAAVVMPNHVHAIATLSPTKKLAQVTQAWKSITAHWAVRKLGVPRPFWQDESFDHIVRDAREFDALVKYVIENPTKAKLAAWPFVFLAEDIPETASDLG